MKLVNVIVMTIEDLHERVGMREAFHQALHFAPHGSPCTHLQD